MPALKVYRTSIGFHDAYVAAPSQKAALAAWGAAANLFARGTAELVTDPALAAEPLAQPGVVVKRLRGTTAEQLAALPPDASPGEKTTPAREQAGAAERERTPPPSRADLDAAEATLAEGVARQDAESAALAQREASLARERATLAKRQAAEKALLEAARDRARSAYDASLRRWGG